MHATLVKEIKARLGDGLQSKTAAATFCAHRQMERHTHRYT